MYSTYKHTLDFFYDYNGNPGITANDVIYGNGYYWIADDSKGMRRLKNNFSLNNSLIGYMGPFTNECFHLSTVNDKLYVEPYDIVSGGDIFLCYYNYRLLERKIPIAN